MNKAHCSALCASMFLNTGARATPCLKVRGFLWKMVSSSRSLRPPTQVTHPVLTRCRLFVPRKPRSSIVTQLDPLSWYRYRSPLSHAHMDIVAHSNHFPKLREAAVESKRCAPDV